MSASAADRADLFDVEFGKNPPAILVAVADHLHAVRHSQWNAGRAVLPADRATLVMKVSPPK